MQIDCHTHCFPDALAARAVPLLAERAGITAYSDGTIAGLKASMQRAGLDLSLLANIATKPEQTPTINAWARSVADEAILPLGTIHPDYPTWREELARIQDYGWRGIKFHPDYQEFFVDEERLFPLYEAIFAADLIVLFHAGVDVGLPPPVHCPPARLRRVVERFPEAKIIAAHLGGWRQWEEVEKHLVGTSVYFDTSYCYPELGPERMRQLILAHGVDKVLFGSDSPWADQAQAVAEVRSLGLAPAEEAAILGGNAARLFLGSTG